MKVPVETGQTERQENVLYFTSKERDEIYCTQSWQDPVKIANATNIFRTAASHGLFKSNTIFTLDKQLAVHNICFPNTVFEPITYVSFSRQNSHGQIINCKVLRNGHHRMWMSDGLGIPIEMQLDTSINIGNVGAVHNMKQLNLLISTQSDQNLGVNSSQLCRYRAVERSVRGYWGNSNLAEA